MPKHVNKEEFIKRSLITHGDSYSYYKVDYIDTETKVLIFCNKHKEYFLQVPLKHYKGSGCKLCGIEKSAQSKVKFTSNEFIETATTIHSGFYNYDNVNFTYLKNKVAINCPKHGNFEQSPQAHLSGNGCRKCANDKNAELQSFKYTFIDKAKKVHGDKYDYSKVEYVNKTINVKILCKQCNEYFEQRPETHLNGANHKGCNYKHNGFRKHSFVELSNTDNHKAKLYLFKCWNDSEQFYKIGITTVNVKKRAWRIPYKKEIIDVFTSEDASYIYDSEKKLNKLLKPFNYSPLVKFSGSTECYKINIEIINQFNKIKNKFKYAN